MEKSYVVGLGEVLWDVLPEGRKLGGAPANFAYHAGQFLGPGSVLAVSALGEDALADETVEALRGHGLECLMPRVPFPTGTVQVTLDGQGIPSYDIRQGVAWDNIPFTDRLRQVAGSCRAVCFGSLAQRSSVSRTTIREFLDATPASCLRVFDVNLRQQFFTKETIHYSIAHSNILKINDEELEVVSRLLECRASDAEGRCRHFIDTYGLDMVVLTCGTDGSYVFAPGTTSFRETPRVAVADTVGAGDAFTGAFVASILEGRPVAEAHSTAVRVSAFVCTQSGAMPAIPRELLG